MPSADCPSLDDLSDFALGKVSDQRREALALHLEECDDCQSTIVSLDVQNDTLLEKIRHPAEDDEFEKEACLRQALQVVAAFGRKPSQDTLSNAQSGKDDLLSDLGRVRDYQLLVKLGQGGMGTVYKALHTQLDRVVALKVLPEMRTEDQAAVARFRREMKAVGRLAHPNIVAAHDAGVDEGRHYLVMELIQGEDLSRLVKKLGPLPVSDACALVRQAAQGLEHARQHGMVHRDIKPSNLMLNAAGQVKILDLGLALLQDSARDEELTTTGQIMGTLDYMAPEQAGDTHEVDVRADVYSLGATLYKLLCGQAPFAGQQYRATVQKLMAIATLPAPPITEQRPDAPPDLVEILGRMLAKNPVDRFQTPGEVAVALEPLAAGSNLPSLAAKAMAATSPEAPAGEISLSTHEDLSSAMTGTQPTIDSNVYDPLQSTPPESDPAKTQPYSSILRTSPTGRFRSKSLVAVVVALGLLFFSALGSVIYFNTGEGTVELTVNAKDITVKLDGNTIEINSPRDTITVKAGGHKMEVTKDGFTTWTNNFRVFRNGKVELEARLTQLPQPLRRNPSRPEAPPAQVASRWKLGPAEDVLPGLVPRPSTRPGIGRWQVETTAPRGSVWSVAWSSDGQYVACGSQDGAVRVYEADTLRLVRLLLGHRGTIYSLAWRPGGQTIASASDDKTVRLWNADGTSGPILALQTEQAQIVRWRQDGKQFAVCGVGDTVRIWDADGTERQSFHAGQGSFPSLAWSTDGEHLATGSQGGPVRLWRTNGTLEQTLEGHTGGVRAIAWSPDGKTIATGSHDKTVRLWDADGTPRQVLKEHNGIVYCLDWSTDGEFLASGGDDQMICVWKADGTEVSSWKNDSGVTSIDWSPDGERLVAGYTDTTVRLWKADGTPGPVISNSSNMLTAVDWSPDSQRLASGHGGLSGHVQIWDAAGAPQAAFDTGGGYALDWSPDGKTLASSVNSTLQLLDVDSLRAKIYPVIREPSVSIAWSPDGGQLAWTNDHVHAVTLSRGMGRQARS